MDQDKSLFDLQLDAIGKAHLKEAARWARFLAITGIVALILVVIITGIAVTVDRPVPEPAQGTAYDLGYTVGTVLTAMLVAALYFFPFLFLLRFANKMFTAIDASDGMALNESFRNLKITFRYLGVLTLIFLVLFGLGLIAGL